MQKYVCHKGRCLKADEGDMIFVEDHRKHVKELVAVVEMCLDTASLPAYVKVRAESAIKEAK